MSPQTETSGSSSGSLSFDQLYELYATDVLRVSYYYLGNREMAEDVTQDVFVKLITNHPVLEEGREKAWLLKVALNRCRDLWRKHLQEIDTARLNAPDTDDAFFYHGNVLLRLNLNKDKVETSKNIKMPIEVAKKMFPIVKKWHENPSTFKRMTIDTKGSGKYEIVSYKNDILTAGCHDIAYAEMERLYKEIISAV